MIKIYLDRQRQSIGKPAPIGKYNALTVETRVSPSRNQTSTLQRAHPGRRVVAACVYDYLFCFWIAVGVVHLINRIAGTGFDEPALLRALTFLFFLTRDFWNGGRGIGKFLLGLCVIDATTGNPPTLRQSVIRNFVLVLPYFIFETTTFIIARTGQIPGDDRTGAYPLALLFACAALVIETYGICKNDGIRLADKISHTLVKPFQQSRDAA